jgi:hypothetical protein
MEADVMTLRAQVFEEASVEPKTGKERSSLREREPERISAALCGFMYGRK